MWARRQNNTYRPSRPLDSQPGGEDAALTMSDVEVKVAAQVGSAGNGNTVGLRGGGGGSAGIDFYIETPDAGGPAGAAVRAMVDAAAASLPPGAPPTAAALLSNCCPPVAPARDSFQDLPALGDDNII